MITVDGKWDLVNNGMDVLDIWERKEEEIDKNKTLTITELIDQN